MTVVQARLADGSSGEATGFDGKLLSLVLPQALAPGQPCDVHLDLATPRTLSGRSVGSRLREDGRFDVRLRLVNLTRDAKQGLLAALG